ncbi:hypothetical protein NC651_039572 [Populus alba x Populus x berolinensis]|nr:hypothetical protein NC651_039572 [Populus alba x Populus x berolinensis]
MKRRCFLRHCSSPSSKQPFQQTGTVFSNKCHRLWQQLQGTFERTREGEKKNQRGDRGNETGKNDREKKTTREGKDRGENGQKRKKGERRGVGGSALPHCHLHLQPRSRHCEPTSAAAPPRSQCREGRTLKEGDKDDIERERKKNKAETQQKKKEKRTRQWGERERRKKNRKGKQGNQLNQNLQTKRRR